MLRPGDVFGAIGRDLVTALLAFHSGPGDLVAKFAQSVANEQVHALRRIGIAAKMTAHADERVLRLCRSRQGGAGEETRTGIAALANQVDAALVVAQRVERELDRGLLARRFAVCHLSPEVVGHGPADLIAVTLGAKANRFAGQIDVAEPNVFDLKSQLVRLLDGPDEGHVVDPERAFAHVSSLGPIADDRIEPDGVVEPAVVVARPVGALGLERDGREVPAVACRAGQVELVGFAAAIGDPQPERERPAREAIPEPERTAGLLDAGAGAEGHIFVGFLADEFVVDPQGAAAVLARARFGPPTWIGPADCRGSISRGRPPLRNRRGS